LQSFSKNGSNQQGCWRTRRDRHTNLATHARLVHGYLAMYQRAHPTRVAPECLFCVSQPCAAHSSRPLSFLAERGLARKEALLKSLSVRPGLSKGQGDCRRTERVSPARSYATTHRVFRIKPIHNQKQPPQPRLGTAIDERVHVNHLLHLHLPRSNYCSYGLSSFARACR